MRSASNSRWTWETPFEVSEIKIGNGLGSLIKSAPGYCRKDAWSRSDLIKPQSAPNYKFIPENKSRPLDWTVAFFQSRLEALSTPKVDVEADLRPSKSVVEKYFFINLNKRRKYLHQHGLAMSRFFISRSHCCHEHRETLQTLLRSCLEATWERRQTKEARNERDWGVERRSLLRESHKVLLNSKILSFLIRTRSLFHDPFMWNPFRRQIVWWFYQLFFMRRPNNKRTICQTTETPTEPWELAENPLFWFKVRLGEGKPKLWLSLADILRKNKSLLSVLLRVLPDKNWQKQQMNLECH